MRAVAVLLLAGQLVSCAVPIYPEPLPCPPCYTATQTLYPPCARPTADCTGPYYPPGRCTRTLDLSGPATPPGKNPACPTTQTVTTVASCPTISACNEYDCKTITISPTPTTLIPDGCTPTTAPSSTSTCTRMLQIYPDMCPMYMCAMPTRECGPDDKPPTYTTTTTTRTVGCNTYVHVGTTPCPMCPTCGPPYYPEPTLGDGIWD